MSFERYLVGNRVYRHGSHAPTTGTVDPMGYVEREMRKRMLGPDGMSDTRSGLAAAALQRRLNPTSPAPTPVRTAAPTAPVGTSAAALQAKLAAVRAEHLAQVHAQQAAAKAKQAARPKVSPVGKIKPAPTALPWDYTAMQDKINAGNVLGQLRNAILAKRQEAEQAFSQGQHQLDTQQPQQEAALLNNFAGRGLAFGSGYGMGVGNLQNEFAGLRAALSNQHTGTLADLINQETQGTSTYNKTLAAIQAALAQRLAKRAGTLGLGGK